MISLKTWFFIGGVTLLGLGFTCLPLGYGANPKRDTSLFSNYADLGAFLNTGIVLMSAGAAVIAITALVSVIIDSIQRVKKRRSKGGDPDRYIDL